MELQELKNIWKAQDARLDEHVQINRQLLENVSLNKVTSLLTEFKLTNIIELVVNAVVSLWFIRFIAIQFSSGLGFVVPAAILLALLLFDVKRNISNLIGWYRINYKNNILETQKELEKFRLRERREQRLILMAIPLFTPLMLMVFAKGWFDFDIYPYFFTWYGLSYFLGSIVVAIILVWFIKKFPDEKMEEAARFLKEIEVFEE